MMRAKKQVVKEFYPEGHSPLWTKDARVGDDCNYVCRGNFEEQKALHPEYSCYNGKSFEDYRKDRKLKDYREEDKAICGHELSKFYKIDWDTMDKQLHPSIVTAFRENFTKLKQHGGDTEKEFRSDKTYAQHWNEPLDAVINRFLDENEEYKIVMIEYSGGGWMDQEVNNQASALVVFEVDER